MEEKKIIYYARTYRHLKAKASRSLLYLLLIVVPTLLAFVYNLHNITRFMSEIGVKVLGKVFPGIPMYIVKDEFSVLGTIECIDMPTAYPGISFVFWNLLVVLLVISLLATGRRKGKPISIYLMLSLIVHVISCIYFVFATNHFPYSVFQYSNLYIKQQIGIWLTFIVLSGLVTAFLGNRGYVYKVLTFFGIMAYSLGFGIVRYVLFLFILERFSILYMAVMFFVFGPFFDFLYLVSIYSMFVNKMVKLYEYGQGKGDWEWS